jgi:hypothetical protein
MLIASSWLQGPTSAAQASEPKAMAAARNAHEYFKWNLHYRDALGLGIVLRPL